MCSVEDNDVPMKRADSDTKMCRLCMKCKEEQAVLITRVNDAFCRGCFQVYVTHKFRAAIGKTKLVRDGELVLVAYSGGPSSSALLSLVLEGLSQRAHKKLRFKPGIIFIDEGATVGWSRDERQAACEKVQTIMHKSGFPCYIKSLEESLDLDALPNTGNTVEPNRTNALPATGHDTPDCDTDVTLPDTTTSPTIRGDTSSGGCLGTEAVQSKYRISDEAEKSLKQTLDGMKSMSAKEDFIRSLRRKILLETARHCGYSKVMLGNCGTQLAVRLLTDISTGRGAHAAMETAFADCRLEDVLFLRPMRDFTSKEVAVYNSMHDVETVFIPTITTKGERGVSIEHLTESFVTGLQADYPSTVSNIMRTGEKLDSSNEKKMDKNCALCQAPLDTSVGASSAMSAVEFSRKISRGRPRGTDEGDSTRGRPGGTYEGDFTQTPQCCGEGDGSCQSSNTVRPRADEVLANLCYGCRLVVRDMDDVCRLPDYVLKDIARRNRRTKMLSEIEGYLLPDS